MWAFCWVFDDCCVGFWADCADLYLGFEEFDAEDGIRAEIPCPFCDEDLDVVVFSLHMEEEHPVEAKMG